MDKQRYGSHSATGHVEQHSGPRTVRVPRTERGFGFTLRHFIVYPPEPKTYQKEREYASEDETEELYFQRVQQGSLEPLDTIFVKNVKEGGPAHIAGLNPGDRIISVNGEPVTGKSYGQVINLIQQTPKDLSVLVVPKEDDILQQAYQSSSQTYDTDYNPGRTVRDVPYSRQSSMDNNPYSSSCSREQRDRKVLSTSNLDSHLFDGPEPYSHFEHDLSRRQLKSSTSYTSGLSVYRDQPTEDNMNKAVFLDRRREFETRAAQENVNPNTSKTYSFGLYFPTKKESRVSSAENLARSVVIRRSRESVLQSTDSQENISKLQSSKTRNVPIEYRHSDASEPNVERYRSQEVLTREHDGRSSHQTQGNSIRHSFPDSVQIWTTSSRRTNENNSPYGKDHGASVTESSPNKRDSYNGRQYVPVINESSISKSQQMSASVDSIDPRSNIYHTEHHLRTSYNNNSHTEQQNQNTPSRTFIVKIGDKHERSSTPNVPQNQAGNHSYGAAFAVTRSPAPTEIEIRQKREPRILVSHRKKQFEDRTDVTPPPTCTTPVNQSRYKTEIEKITTFRKFDGIQSRLATFEKSTNSIENVSRSRSQTPVSGPSISKVRQMSQERLKSPEPLQNSNTQFTQGNSQSNYSDSAPIRIYVSQGTSNTSGSPIVEIVPMQSSSSYEITEARGQGQYVSHNNQTDISVESRDQIDGESGQKPVRKASFLSAVNAPYSRYLPPSGYENETDLTPKSSRTFVTNQTVSRDLREGSATPTNFQWTSRTPSPARALSPTSMSPPGVSVASISVSPSTGSRVRLRNKPEISAEDYETKLHRRTSYLMATAKDRAAVNLSMSPNATVPLDPNTPATLSKHKSMRKLKDFFGEKTPKIVEAQERKIPDPASPIQQVTKEGSLGVKVDMIDGKRASDRSWRPVWAVLRGHALYLCKERRDPANYVVHALSVRVRVGSGQQTNIFSYDEQPISIKSCIVDIAHSYTKRKNVFRMKTYNGSEYLFQAEDQIDMLSWIEKIKTNNDPDSDACGVTSTELILRKSQELVETAAPATKTSPPQSQKMSKKLSVLSIKQKIPHSPSLKRRKTTSGDKDESGKPKTWKGKLGKSIKKQFGSSPAAVDRITPVPESTYMFGVPLEDCTPSPNNEFVPLVVDLCIQIVEAKGLEMTGVYRIPGNKAAVTLLQEEFNKGIEAMNLEHEKWSDVNVISSLLKSFFRELPEPLIPDELYQPFIDANRLDDPEKRMLKLKRLIHELPEHHFETFKHLAKHLNKVAQYGDINRMEAKNLAIVFGPTLIRKADDSMVAMFTDMSDHCKIIESIVLHVDWFFGSWENDNIVPTDDDATECTSIVSALSSNNRDDSEVNTKEIVSSIVEAANRKLRGENAPQIEKRSVSITEKPPGFNERNIDQEIYLRTRKIESSTSRSSPNLAAMQRSNDLLKVTTTEISTDRRMAKSQEFGEREFSDFDFIDSDKESCSAYLTPTTRYFSDDSLLDKNDELELSHSTQSGSFSRLSRETIDSLRRIELEARALREREERRQRDLEKRKLEKQRIEQDILQTQQELEIEERHSVEDLLNAPGFGAGSKEYSSKRRMESSGYRNSRSSDSRLTRDSANGGKYFVVKGNSSQSRYMRSSRPPRQTSVESLVIQSKRTGSLENMADGHPSNRAHSRPYAHVRARKGDDRSKRDSAEIKRRSVNGVARSNSVRRGSLDSLIDLIEKRDNRMSWASTDSDEGLDLLTTLTSTFDQKLQTLSSPKLTQSPAPLPPRRAPYNSSSSSLSTNTSVVESTDSPIQTAQHRLPPQIPLSSVMNRGNSTSDIPTKQYRDPSLHRTPPKSDTKIGLATRFERTSTHNPMYEGHSEPNLNSIRNYGLSLHSDVTYSVDAPVVNTNNASNSRVSERHDAGDSRVSSVMVVISSPSVMSADSRKSAGYSASHYISTTTPVMSAQSAQTNSQSKIDPYLPKSVTSKENRPISKSEKTEVNVKLSRSVDKNKDNVMVLRDGVLTSKSRSASPPPTNRKKGEKKKHRRHTVGGTSDSENMRAMNEILHKDEPRLSAWEQLRPNVGQHSNIGPHSSMQTWLRNERLRGSSPDLSMRRVEKSSAKKN